MEEIQEFSIYLVAYQEGKTIDYEPNWSFGDAVESYIEYIKDNLETAGEKGCKTAVKEIESALENDEIANAMEIWEKKCEKKAGCMARIHNLPMNGGITPEMFKQLMDSVAVDGEIDQDTLDKATQIAFAG